MNTELAPVVQLLPEPQREAWLGMAVAKNEIVTELKQAELNAQSLLVVSDNYADIDAALANYRKAHAEMVEVRKGFTNQIDAGIIQPLMAFEKRVDPKSNEVYLRLSQRSLALRKEEADKVARINQVNQELASFKAHCTNEFFKCAAEYRSQIRAEITKQYEYWLNEGKQPNLEQLASGLEAIPTPAPAKFKPIYITTEQMSEVYNAIHKPDYSSIFEEMVAEMKETFANFDSDLANKSAAIARQHEVTQLNTLHEQSQLAEETAINTLIVNAEAVVIAEPTIKRTYTILTVESEAWAKNVIAGFITNLPALAKYIRVKSWAKLTIGQMAEYLAKLANDSETKVNGLTYESIER
jgi:hypothetical protein